MVIVGHVNGDTKTLAEVLLGSMDVRACHHVIKRLECDLLRVRAEMATLQANHAGLLAENARLRGERSVEKACASQANVLANAAYRAWDLAEKAEKEVGP